METESRILSGGKKSAGYRSMVHSINWDINVIDVLLHAVSPIIMVVSAVYILVLMLSVGDFGQMKRKASCFTPAAMTSNMVNYIENTCGSWKAKLYPTLSDVIPSHADRSHAFVMPNLDGCSEEIYYVLLTAIICIIPFAAWKLVGDGNGLSLIRIRFTQMKANSWCTFKMSFLWYLITRILGCVAAVVAVIVISWRHTYSEYGLRICERMNEDTVLCDIRVRQLGENIRAYTVQCSLDLSASILGLQNYVTLSKLLLVWFVIILVFQAANLLLIMVTLVLSNSNDFRWRTLKRLTKGEVQEEDKDNYSLGVTDSVVAVLACRNGYSEEISNNLQRQLSSLMDKTD